jgi:cell division protein FtsB
LVILALWVVDGINKVSLLNKEKDSFLEKKRSLENEITVLDRKIKLFEDPVWLDFYLRKNYSFLHKDEKLIIIKKDGGS